MNTKKISKILGVGLAVAMLTSLLVVAAPASAGTLSWSTEDNMPGLPVTANQLMPSGASDICDIAVSADGKTVYAVSASYNKLFKSTDGGVTWTEKTVGTASSTCLVAVSPSDASRLAVVDSVSDQLFVSSDGGSSFSQITLPTTANLTISDLDLAKVSGSTHTIGLAGTDNGTAFIQYYSWGSDSASWTSAMGSSFTGKHDNGVAALAFKFSPNYPSDKTFAVLTVDNASSAYYELVNTSTKKFNADGAYGSNFPVLVADSVGTVTAGSIALAPNFLGSDEASRVAFVGLASSNTATAGVTRLMDYRKKIILESTQIKSVDYNGNFLVAGEATTNTVWYSTDMLASSPTITSVVTSQKPGGTEKVIVKIAADNTTMAATSGANSAFALSKDKGVTFNDVALIDTALTNLQDVAVSADGTKIFLLSDNGAYTSLWKKDAGKWVRVFSVNDVGPFIVRTPDATAVYVAKLNASSGLYYSNDGAEKNISARSYADSSGIVDMAVESAQVVYVLTSSGSVRKSTDAGFTWGSSRLTGLGSGATITSVAKDQVLVGSTDGYVAYSTDGAASSETWTKINYQVESSGNVHATADKLASGGIIYAATSASGGNVRKWTIGTSTNSWTDIINGTLTGGATGIALKGTALYVITADGTDSYLFRTLTANTATSSTDWSSKKASGVDFDRTPTALRLSSDSSGNKLWAIDTEGTDELYSYLDNLFGAGPKLTAPIDKAFIQVNPVTGRTYDVTFVWAQPSSKASKYDLEVSLDDKFTQTVYKTQPAPGDTVSTVSYTVGPYTTSGTTTGAPFDWNAGVTYYWRVRVAIDGPVESPWTTARSFTINNAEQFNITGPTLGSTTSVKPTFAWTPAAGKVLYYELNVSEDPTFATIRWVGRRNIDQTFYTVEEPLENGKQYFWRVRAVYAAAEGVATQYTDWKSGTFTTEPVPTTPAAPITVNPPGPTSIQIIEVPTTEPIPSYLLWTIIGIGAIMVIALIILIVRTRRVV